MTAQNDFLKKAPEFLEAFDEVRRHGFFGKIEFKLESFHATKTGLRRREPLRDRGTLSFSALGFLPSNSDYAVPVPGLLMDAEEVLVRIRAMFDGQRIRLTPPTTIRVTSENWHLWNRSGSKVIGTCGRMIDFYLHIQYAVPT